MVSPCKGCSDEALLAIPLIEGRLSLGTWQIVFIDFDNRRKERSGPHQGVAILCEKFCRQTHQFGSSLTGPIESFDDLEHPGDGN
jgi:hypothetical protein